MSEASHSTTIRQIPETDETRTSQTREIQDLVIGTAEIRDVTGRLNEHAKNLDEEVLELQLDDRASELAQEDVGDLLTSTRTEFGLSWEDLASLIGVTSAAVRKWRRGEPASNQNRHHLARVLAFCELLGRRDPRITDPAQWLTEQFHGESSIRAADLYAAGYESQLLSVARGSLDRTALLDKFDSAWRTNHSRSRWEVKEGPDGMPSIVEREGQ